MTLEAGHLVCHYRLVEKIGEGGMGVVWKAVDQKLDREVAIKFLPESFEGDAGRLARFKREARVLAALSHPNIVTVHSVEEAEGSLFFTMELVRGRPLTEVIPDGGLPVDAFLRIAIPVADAIAAAHAHGITHGDLKPANIMFSAEGRVKVLDFGLARPLPHTAVSPSSNAPTAIPAPRDRISGTLLYMSPEQIRGEPLDHRSDIFSLGIILHEMATGGQPFQGETAADVIAAILRDAPQRVDQINPDMPHDLGNLVRLCLHKDPAHRLQAALDLRNELEEIGREAGGCAAAQETVPSIAVLPFVDMSRDKDHDYFCEGIAEEIINALTAIKGLRVSSRTSTFQFKNAALESREIGRRLRVTNLLEGSVRKDGDRLRITVELADVAGGYNLWSRRFDCPMKDIFAVQEEIAHSIARALQVTLTQKERDALRQTHTTDVKAYDYYLRGRNFYYQFRNRGVEFALQMFSHAIALDPGYGLAYAGIADCHSFLYNVSVRSEENRQKAEAASRKALDLAPGLAQVHTSRGLALSLSGRHGEAEREFETATSLDPTLFEAHYFYARDCFAQGHTEKAAGLYERAGVVRPEDYQPPLLVAQIYADLGRDDAARESRLRGLSIVEEHLKLNPDDARAVYMGANALVSLGDMQRGLEWARRAVAMEPEDPMVLYNVACVRSLAGQMEQAIDCLEKAVRNGHSQKEWYQMDSNLDPLRAHPRFQALMKEIE